MRSTGFPDVWNNEKLLIESHPFNGSDRAVILRGSVVSCVEENPGDSLGWTLEFCGISLQSKDVEMVRGVLYPAVGGSDVTMRGESRSALHRGAFQRRPQRNRDSSYRILLQQSILTPVAPVRFGAGKMFSPSNSTAMRASAQSWSTSIRPNHRTESVTPPFNKTRYFGQSFKPAEEEIVRSRFYAIRALPVRGMACWPRGRRDSSMGGLWDEEGASWPWGGSGC